MCWFLELAVFPQTRGCGSGVRPLGFSGPGLQAHCLLPFVPRGWRQLVVCMIFIQPSDRNQRLSAAHKPLSCRRWQRAYWHRWLPCFDVLPTTCECHGEWGLRSCTL